MEFCGDDYYGDITVLNLSAGIKKNRKPQLGCQINYNTVKIE